MASRVLLVDDEEDIRTIGEICLRDVGGFETELAGSGAEALERAARSRPDVILLDAMMPGMDGLSTMRALKERPETAGIPVIFMTARVQPREVAQYLEGGAVGVLRKPFDPMTLASEVLGVLATL